MRQAQTTLEYVVLIGIVAVAIIAMLVYMKRGFEGNLRQLSEQAGAGYYDPRNTAMTSIETKRTQSTVVSSSSSSVTFGSDGSTSSGTSANTESGKETVDTQTSESTGNLSGDTWH